MLSSPSDIERQSTAINAADCLSDYSYSLRAHSPFSIQKMALNSYDDATMASTNNNNPNGEKMLNEKHDNMDNGSPMRYNPTPKLDHSRFDRKTDGAPDPKGRICGVLPHLRGYDFGDSDSGSDILGKQIELEAGNALQYRTCSWQKVCISVY